MTNIAIKGAIENTNIPRSKLIINSGLFDAETNTDNRFFVSSPFITLPGTPTPTELQWLWNQLTSGFYSFNQPFVIKDLNDNLINDVHFLGFGNAPLEYSVEVSSSPVIQYIRHEYNISADLSAFYELNKNSYSQIVHPGGFTYIEVPILNSGFKIVFDNGAIITFPSDKLSLDTPSLMLRVFDPQSYYVNISSDERDFILANPTTSYKPIVEVQTNDPQYQISVQIPQQTITINNIESIPNSPVVADISSLAYGYIHLENNGAGALSQLGMDNLPAGTVFDITISKNSQSITISGLTISQEWGRNGFLYVPENSSDISLYNYSYFGNSNYRPSFIDGYFSVPETFNPSDLDTFLTDNNVLVHPWGFSYDPDLVITFNISSQTGLKPGSYTIESPTTVQLRPANELPSYYDTRYRAAVVGWSVESQTQFDALLQSYYNDQYAFANQFGFKAIQSSDNGGGGSGSGVTNLVSIGGKAVGLVSVNPTATEILVNGQPLPIGSVLKNSVTGQKFLKVEGSATSFVSIELSPKVSWDWTAESNAAWAVLQSL